MGIVAAVETVKPSIPATLDAQALVELGRQEAWPGAIVERPFGFDKAISAEAARIKGIHSQVAGHADLLLVPDLNAGNMLYKSFNYIGGGDCAGLVLGARDVHRVRNAHDDRVSISIHAYGGNIGRIRRHVFPPEGGPAKAFMSGYASGAD